MKNSVFSVITILLLSSCSDNADKLPSLPVQYKDVEKRKVTHVSEKSNDESEVENFLYLEEVELVSESWDMKGGLFETSTHQRTEKHVQGLLTEFSIDKPRPISKKTDSTVFVNELGEVIYRDTLVQIEQRVVKNDLPSVVDIYPLRYKDNAFLDLKYLDNINGFPSSYVYSSFVDSRGDIWFGTYGEGVVMYDGTFLTHFKSVNGLIGDRIWSISEDKEGNIWFGSLNSGVCYFDGEQFFQISEEEGLLSNFVWDIKVDDAGHVWLGTANGLSEFVFNSEGECFVRNYTENEGLSSNYILALELGDNNDIWVGTNKGLDRISEIDEEDRNIQNFFNDSLHSGDVVNSILTHSSGDLYVGTTNSGLIRINDISELLLTNKSTCVEYRESNGLISNYIKTVYEDSNNGIWLGTYGNGVVNFSAENFEVKEKDEDYSLHGIEISNSEGLSNEYVWNFSEDDNSNLWIGTDGGGVSLLKTSSFKNYTENQGLSERFVWGFAQDSSSNIWMATHSYGASVLSGDSQIKKFRTGSGLENVGIRSIEVDNNQCIWLATHTSGLFKIEKPFSNLPHITNITGVRGKGMVAFSHVDIDEKGSVWAMSKGFGLIKITDSSSYKLTEEENLFSNNLKAISTTDDNQLLLFTEEGLGVVTSYSDQKIGVNQISMNEGLSSNSVETGTIDGQGRYWIGTADAGINVYDGNFVYEISTDQGLSSVLISSMVYDDVNDDIWVGSGNGISRIDIGQRDELEVNSIENYDQQSGLKGLDTYPNSIFIDIEHRLWVGGGNSVVSLDLQNQKQTNLKPSVKLVQLDVNNQHVSFNREIEGIDFDSKRKFRNLPENPIFEIANNHLTFYFSAKDWRAPEKLKYSFLMDGPGMTPEWSEPDVKTVADFRNLSGGQYTFSVAAIGQSGVWSDVEEYSFEILPPWWLTWWAKSIYVVLLIALIFVVVKVRTIKLRKRQAVLEREVEEATEEIRAQKEQVEGQKEIVEQQHQEILDSIHYAERIQRSFLATDELLKTNLRNYFVYFQPKEAVSGDFYWAGQLKNDNFAVVNADSTGHGVPGAIMSILNVSAIEKSVDKGTTIPAEIFNEARTTIIERLKKDGSSEGGKDGMDASMISFNKDKSEMSYVAANNPIWILRAGELIEIKPEKMPVGKHDLDHVPFVGGTIALKKDDIVYTLTDGFQDQFGGEKGKKFKVKPFKRLVIENGHLSMDAQKELFEQVLNGWKGKMEQVDDICFIGIKI